MLSVMIFRILGYTACLEQLNKSPFIRDISTKETHSQMFGVQKSICICTAISLYGLQTKRVERRSKATMQCCGDFTAAVFKQHMSFFRNSEIILTALLHNTENLIQDVPDT